MAKRKLTTIFCADAVQYGAMMATNEDATLARLEDYRGIMRSQFGDHDGREINTWGDAIIAEFESVVEAVRCAVTIQSAIASRNEMLEPSERLQFRIGINLGDVIHQGHDIYGDGVNVASRLESLASPGGIMVSKSVYDFAARQLAVGFDFAGEQAAKEGEEPIVGYSVRFPGTNQSPEEQSIDPKMENDESEHRLRDDARTLAASFGALPTITRFRNWFEAQGRTVRFSVTMIGFFFAINVLFTGIATPWFIFPSLPFLMMILIGRKKDKEPK